MSGVNAHAIITPHMLEAGPAGIEAGAELAPAAWQRGLRCYVEVLVPLHPLLGAATKVGHGCNLIAFMHTRDRALLHVHPFPSPLFPPLPQVKQQLQFRLPLSRPVLAFLWDHQVQAAPIMPGAAYFETAAAAGRTLLHLAEPAVALTGAAIAAPLRLPAAAEAGSVVLTAEVALASGSLSICSAAGQVGKAAGGKAAPETLHLQGSLAPVASSASAAAASATPSMSLDAARAACQQPQDTAAVYSGLQAAGLQYGPAFRQLRGIQRGDSSAAARLGSSSSSQADTDVSGFLLHPALLDSGLQLGALVPEPASGGGSAAAGGAFVPAGLSVYLIQRPVQQGSALHAIVRRSPDSSRRAPGATSRDHALLSGTGAVLAVLDGLEAKQLGGSGGAAAKAAAAAAAGSQASGLLYDVSWQAAGLASGAAVPLPEAAVQRLPSSRAVPLVAASSSLLVLQAAMQQQATAVQLQTVAQQPPSSIAPAASDPAASGGSALWGMLRAFAQEAPAVAHGGVSFDPLASNQSGDSRSRILVSHASPAAMESDGYGSLVQGGAALTAALLPSSAVHPAPGPYHLMPKPRGAFRWAVNALHDMWWPPLPRNKHCSVCLCSTGGLHATSAAALLQEPGARGGARWQRPARLG